MTADTAELLSNDLLTPQEVQRILRCGRNALYNSIKSKSIPSIKFGGSVRVPASWLRDKLKTVNAA